MLRLLAIGNSLKVVVETLNKEFDVPKKTIYAEYYKMHALKPRQRHPAQVQFYSAWKLIKVTTIVQVQRPKPLESASRGLIDLYG